MSLLSDIIDLAIEVSDWEDPWPEGADGPAFIPPPPPGWEGDWPMFE